MALLGNGYQPSPFQGILGQPAGQYNVPAPAKGLGSFDVNSLLSNPLLHAGVALLGSRGPGSAAPAALQGLMQGAQYKSQLEAQQREQAEREKREKALQGLGETMPGLAPFIGTGLEGPAMTMLGKQASTTAPSNVREWEYFNNLSPEQKQQYLAMKRASQLYKMGDVTMQHDPLGAAPTVAGQPGATQAGVQAQLTDQAAQKAAAEKAAEQAIVMSGEAFEKMRPVGTAIANIDEAISLLDQGAKTGVVVSKLPSVSAASVALDNLQGQMGLDVIGNTTFGALSEAELKFALNTALPQKLSPPELRDWLQRKKEAQSKLSKYLEEAAVFLGTPGNTVADFIKMKRGGNGGTVRWDELP